MTIFHKKTPSIKNWLRGFALISLISMSLTTGLMSISAQGRGQVQVLNGKIEPGEVIVYLLPDLSTGQTLYIHASATSGNLDPIVFITDTILDSETIEAEFEAARDQQIIASSSDPLEILDELRDQYTLAWDDDSGGGLTASLAYDIPADGDYRLIVAGSLTLLGGNSFGDYKLLIGLDAPQVLDGEAEAPDEIIAVLDVEATPLGIGVQEITGTLNQDKTSTFVELNDFKEGDTLYAYIEATSGDLVPTLMLMNFAGKPIRSANMDGSETQASLQYTFPGDSRNYQIDITNCCEGGSRTSGDYRLLLGVNAPEVMTGNAQPDGRVVARDPIAVDIGLILEQIIEVDQQSEFFTAVGTVKMEWNDPLLAFNPESCQCEFIAYSNEGNFNRFLSESNGRWPDFTFVNQQGNRWTQNRNLVVFSNGDAQYFERFTTNFQVDFDFRRFPFDTQTFVIRIDSLFPEERYKFSSMENGSAISTEHGEDEFILEDLSTEDSSVSSQAGRVFSRFTFSFDAPRHLSYYIFQIFVPILLIIVISWITFFLKDYTRRIEVASANLLLFIAFSFSLSENYPRLGYLTILDAIMAIMFVINALVIVYNVWLRRLEMNDRVEMVERIDDILDWTYPLIYLLLFGGIYLWFF